MTVIFCASCAYTRTIDDERRMESHGAPTTCFRCGGREFVSLSRLASWRRPEEFWCVTEPDKRLLRALAIAR